jgi:hypothetical protein
MRQPVPAKLVLVMRAQLPATAAQYATPGTEADNVTKQSAFLLMQDKRVQDKFMQYKGRLCKTSTCLKAMSAAQNKPQDADTD